MLHCPRFSVVVTYHVERLDSCTTGAKGAHNTCQCHNWQQHTPWQRLPIAIRKFRATEHRRLIHLVRLSALDTVLGDPTGVGYMGDSVDSSGVPFKAIGCMDGMVWHGRVGYGMVWIQEYDHWSSEVLMAPYDDRTGHNQHKHKPQHPICNEHNCRSGTVGWKHCRHVEHGHDHMADIAGMPRRHG